MKTFAKVIREGQNFYIQHTPSRGEYDSMESIIGDEEIVVKMQNNRKEYESGYLYITKNLSDESMCVSNFILQNRLLGLTRAGIYNHLKEVKSGCEVYIMYYDAKLYTGKPVKLDLIWASSVLDQNLDNNSRIKLSRDVARLIPRYIE
jgi:hypothetical protein